MNENFDIPTISHPDNTKISFFFKPIAGNQKVSTTHIIISLKTKAFHSKSQSYVNPFREQEQNPERERADCEEDAPTTRNQ